MFLRLRLPRLSGAFTHDLPLFTDTAVTRKLGLGFGFMVLLTLLVAAIAVTSLNGLLERNQKQTRLSQVEEASYAVDTARTLFEQSGSDAHASR